MNNSSPSFIFDSTLKKLTVRGVSEFPQSIFEYGDTIEILDMSNNQLEELPDDLNRLSNLRVAFFSGNKFQEVPPQLSGCENLEMVGLKSCGIEEFGKSVLPRNLKGLILTDNRLTKLPDSIGEYRQLRKLMLTGNSFMALPASMNQLSRLELIRLASNKLQEAPAWLAELPNLSWYADSDNEFNTTLSHKSLPATEFKWSDLILGEKIGESSKNVVYAATLNEGEAAMKVFGSGVTTDGSADSEILAALTAGDHPHIVGALGGVAGIENGQKGLLMPRITEEYRPLGLPPDMISLTRDVYREDLKFTSEHLRAIALSIASALEYLHAKGVMHGDVYAHNVLVAPDGDAKLCDFGAASLYNHDLPSELWREKLDVLAYGRLVGELLQRITEEDLHSKDITILSKIAKTCVNRDMSLRPTFAKISKVLC